MEHQRQGGGLYATFWTVTLGAAGMHQLSPAQRQALERLQAAQAAAIALNAPADDPVTHYLQQSSSRQSLRSHGWLGRCGPVEVRRLRIMGLCLWTRVPKWRG